MSAQDRRQLGHTLLKLAPNEIQHGTTETRMVWETSQFKATVIFGDLRASAVTVFKVELSNRFSIVADYSPEAIEAIRLHIAGLTREGANGEVNRDAN